MSKKKQKQVNVNLGCGTHIVKDWVNIDCVEPSNATGDFVLGTLQEIPLEAGTVDYILCDNVFEHLPMSDVPVALQEIRRVLKKGGRAVIIVPDFRSAANDWLKIDHDAGFNPMFYQYLSEVIYGGQNHEGEFHRTPFCAGYFNFVLRGAGFREYRLVIHPAFGDCPNYPGVRNPHGKLRNAELVADITKS